MYKEAINCPNGPFSAGKQTWYPDNPAWEQVNSNSKDKAQGEFREVALGAAEFTRGIL